MSVWLAIVLIASLLPIAIRVTRARQSGRSVHLFDDVFSHFNLPILWLALVVPLPRAVNYALAVVLTVLTVISIYRLLRGRVRD